jgi:hypothetical protein
MQKAAMPWTLDAITGPLFMAAFTAVSFTAPADPTAAVLTFPPDSPTAQARPGASVCSRNSRGAVDHDDFYSTSPAVEPES